ncbi:MAG: DUF1569 domain-containing protein [Ignavibacteria bacterium]|nr:DUF1569 domain-containing protein [Ignavibacteria bacterium]
MKDLFNPEVNSKFIERINMLSKDSKALWGKMGPAEMLFHCSMAMKSAFGDVKLKRAFIGYLFGSMAKKNMLSDKPFKQGLPTDSSFKAKEKKNFEDEKKLLIELVKKFETGGPGGITSESHPFFGKLNIDEWNTLTTKHLDHHLGQFGV